MVKSSRRWKICSNFCSESLSLAVSLQGKECNERLSVFHFLKQLGQQYCIKSWLYPSGTIQKIRHAFGDDAMGITQISIIVLKISSPQRPTHVLVGSIEAEMMRSLIKCRLSSCKTILTLSENSADKGGNKH